MTLTAQTIAAQAEALGASFDGELLGQSGILIFTDNDPQSPAFGGTFAVKQSEYSVAALVTAYLDQRARFAAGQRNATTGLRTTDHQESSCCPSSVVRTEEAAR
jgi:hypothetical protein